MSLDTNGNGRVGFEEVASFAKDKGLDYGATLEEFAKFDSDRDGSLDVAELAGALGLSAPVSTSVGLGEVVSMPSMPTRALRTPAKADFAPAAGSSRRQSFADRAATLTDVADGLDVELRKEREAEELDRRAADLRSKAHALARRTSQEAREASALAARRRAEQLFQNITDLEDKAGRAEVAAAVLIAKGAAESTEMIDVTQVASSALQGLMVHK